MTRSKSNNLEIKMMESRKNKFLITTDKNKLDISLIHSFLTNESGWSKGITYEIVKTSINGSLNFGLYFEDKQIGFGRVISDYSTIAYLGDVFILKDFRGQGLSKWLMDSIISHEELQNLRRWILLTDTAEWLYEKYGFKKILKPEIYMEKFNPSVYK